MDEFKEIFYWYSPGMDTRDAGDVSGETFIYYFIINYYYYHFC